MLRSAQPGTGLALFQCLSVEAFWPACVSAAPAILMIKILDILRKFFRREAGLTAIEYGLLASVITVAIILGAGLIGTNVNNVFHSLGDSVSDPAASAAKGNGNGNGSGNSGGGGNDGSGTGVGGTGGGGAGGSGSGGGNTGGGGNSGKGKAG